MCYFKSFVFSLKYEKFYSRYGINSHTELCSINVLNDDNVIKFELVPTWNSTKNNYYFNFIIDTLRTQLFNDNQDKVLRCFNTLPNYIMSNIIEWTKEGIETKNIKCITEIINPDNLETYVELNQSLNNSKYALYNFSKQIERINELKAYLKDANFIISDNEKLLITENIKDKEKQKNKYIRAIKQAQKKLDAFIKEYATVTINIEPLTIDNITEQIDNAFNEYLNTNKE